MELATGEIALLLLLMLGTGVVAGLLAGLLGVGGGIVIVPILFLVFELLDFPEGIAMHVAVATSLATIVPTSIASARAHHAKGNVDAALLRRWAPWVALGAAAGGVLASGLDGEQLKLVFGVVALAVALNMASPKVLVLGSALPASGAAQGAMAGGIGLFSSLMGIGGGTLTVPTLSMFSFPAHRAVGTASAFGLVIAVPAVIGFVWAGWAEPGRPPFSLGYVNLVAACLIFPVTTRRRARTARGSRTRCRPSGSSSRSRCSWASRRRGCCGPCCTERGGPAPPSPLDPSDGPGTAPAESHGLKLPPRSCRSSRL